MKIINETKGTVLAENVIVANTFFGWIIGLLNRSEILPGEALLIRPCNSVHTFFMKFPIDVVFVSKDHRILITIPNMKPFRFSQVVLESRFVLELPAGTLEAAKTYHSDIIQIS